MPDPPSGSERRYSSPDALNQAITQRAKAVAQSEVASLGLASAEAVDYVGRRVNQIRQEVAFRVALQRLFARSGNWVLKGGVALQFRLDPSRPSRDIDLAVVGDFLDHAEAVTELRRALRDNAQSFFSFDTEASGAGLDEIGSLSLQVVALIGNREFSRFSIDLAPSKADIASQGATVHGVLPGVEFLGEPFEIALLRLEDQIAEKICAIHEVHGPSREVSSRWRDLADLAMIADQIDGIDGSRVLQVLTREVELRPKTLPAGLPKTLSLTQRQAGEWRQAWGSGGRDVVISFDEAHAGASKFVDPMLEGMVEGKVWGRRLGKWIEPSGRG